MQCSLLFFVFASGAINHAQAHRGIAPDINDPFGALMPPTNGNPNIQIPMMQPDASEDSPDVRTATEEERLLNSEAVLNEQVELDQEERMQVECVGMEHLREVTEYETEQAEVESEIKSIRNFNPTEAEHKCLPLHKRNKYMPSKFFTDHDRFVNLPAFPERLGELVIEEVVHTDKDPGSNQHVVLELEGCTSCANDLTETVEWGGLLPTDETGSYRKMYRGSSNEDNFGKKHFFRGDRTPIVQSKTTKSGNPPVFDFAATGTKNQKYVKRYQYKYSSYDFDAKIEPEAKQIAKEAVTDNETINAHFVAMHKDDETHLMQELREQTKHVPFNHKMEQLHFNVYVCSEAGGRLDCPPTPQETLIVLDGALVVESSATMLLDQLGALTGFCSYGPCAKSKGISHKGWTWPYTMCSACGASPCKAARTEPSERLHSLSKLGPENWFNCMVERLYTKSGYADALLQSDTDYHPEARRGHGMLYHGTSSPGHVSGHINWHVTIPKTGECTPFMDDVAYVGIGVDECDKCGGQGVDVDIGVLLLSCGHDASSDKLGSPSACEYYHHLNYAQRSTNNNYYGISEDSRGGEGEGDDEWVFLNLAKLREQKVTHALILANIYSCQNGQQPAGGIDWQDLEGAFLRVVGSTGTSKEFPMAETISYIDLDEMRGPAGQGAAVLMLYLSDNQKLAKRKEIERTDGAADSDRVWKMLATKKPITGRTISQSAKDLRHFGLDVHENTLGEQAQSMNLMNTMATGQQVPDLTNELGPVVSDGIKVAHNTHVSGETTYEQKAKHMDDHKFWQNFAATLPGGPPGSDAMCVR